MPIWGAQNAIYGLLELRSALDTLGALPKWDEKQSLANSALGRNVALFDTTRLWAYRAWTRYTDRTEWEETVQAYAWNKNLGPIADTFTRGPLGLQEVTHLARSIARWVWRSDNRAKGSEQFEADFHEIQQRRGRKGGLATVAKIRQRGISEAQREANRIRVTKIDPSYALEVLT